MKKVTVRVPASTSNLGPGFDSFGCALTLYTDISFEEKEEGLCITGCDEAYAGKDNLAYVAYCAAMEAMGEPLRGLRIHIDANIPVCRGLGSSAALLVAGAMGANALHGNKLSKEELLTITNVIEGHPDNLAPAIFGGLTASMVEDGIPATVGFPLHPDWKFLALVPDFELSTKLSRSVLPEKLNRSDAIYNISHALLLLKALETGDEELLRLSMRDKVHQPYRQGLITDFEQVQSLVAATGGCLCISGAGPTLLCITKDDKLASWLGQKLPAVTTASWQVLRLKAEPFGAQVL